MLDSFTFPLINSLVLYPPLYPHVPDVQISTKGATHVSGPHFLTDPPPRSPLFDESTNAPP